MALSDERKLKQKNRYQHAKRANAFLNAEQFEQIKEIKARASRAIKNREAFRYDKYARKLVNIAETFDVDETTLFTAVLIRELGNRNSIEQALKEAYPEITEREIRASFVAGTNLRETAREIINRELTERKEGRELTDAEYNDIQTSIKTARIAERKARKALDVYYKQLTRSTGLKVVDAVLDAYNLVRSLAYSTDLGFILRQGGIPFLAYSKAWAKALQGIKPAFQSETKFEHFVDGIYSDTRRKVLESFGAEFETIGDEVSFNEEFLSTLTGKIPLVKHTNRAHSLTTDLFRFNIGNQLFAEIDRMGLDEKQTEKAKQFLAGKWVNIITGKGYVGNFYGVGSTSSKVVSTILGAPRFALAGFQYLYYTNPARMALLPKGARKIIAKQTLRVYTPLAIMAVILSSLGLMSADPEDKDFLIINGNKLAELTGIESFKDQHFDFLGGKKEPIRLVYGLPLKALFYAMSGNEEGYKRIWKSLHFEFFGSDERFSPYLRGKLNPAMQIGFNLWEGEDIGGQPYDWSNVPADLISPILAKEIFGAASYDKKKNILHTQSALDWKKENLGRTLITLALSFIGVGVGNYPKRETTTAYKQAQSQTGFITDEYEKDESKQRRQVKSALKRLIREGEDVSKEIEDYLAAGVINEDDAEAIKNARKTTAIEDLLRSAKPEAVEHVLKFASRDENWLNNRMEEAETEKEALENLLTKKRKNQEEELAGKELSARRKSTIEELTNLRASFGDNPTKEQLEQLENKLLPLILKDEETGQSVLSKPIADAIRFGKSQTVISIKQATDAEKATEIFSEAVQSADEKERKNLVETLKEKFDNSDSLKSKRVYFKALKPYLSEKEAEKMSDDAKITTRTNLLDGKQSVNVEDNRDLSQVENEQKIVAYDTLAGLLLNADDAQSAVEVFQNAPREQKERLAALLLTRFERTTDATEKRIYRQAILAYNKIRPTRPERQKRESRKDRN